MSLFYGWILNVALIVLAAQAFSQAEERGRLVLLILTGAAFGLPFLWPSRTMSLIAFLGKLALALGYLLYVRWAATARRF